MTNKIIDKLVDISIYCGSIEHEINEFAITKESSEAFDRLQETRQKLRAQIEILKEVLENDK